MAVGAGIGGRTDLLVILFRQTLGIVVFTVVRAILSRSGSLKHMLARVQVRQKEQEELDRMLKRFKPKMKQLDAMRVRVTMGDEKSALEFLREVRESLELPESIKAKLEVCCCYN